MKSNDRKRNRTRRRNRRRNRKGTKSYAEWQARKLEGYFRSLRPDRRVNAVPFLLSKNSVIRKHTGKQGFRALRTCRGQWFHNGERVQAFMSWGGAVIHRGHHRSRNRTRTISGIAFPTRYGKRPSFGGNTAPTLAQTLDKQLHGCVQSAFNIIGYYRFVEWNNKQIRRHKAYHEGANKYHPLYNPNGISSQWREVPETRKRNR